MAAPGAAVHRTGGGPKGALVKGPPLWTVRRFMGRRPVGQEILATVARTLSAISVGSGA